MANNRSEPQWKAEIDRVHQKHLDNIQADGVDGLAFHYTSPSGLLGIFSKQNIWFSDCDYLNDSSESNYFFDLSSTVFGTTSPSKMVENLFFRSYLLAMFHSNYNGSGRESFSRESERRYVFSLSVDEDSLSLWNNYTKTIDATGYNIGFNVEKLINSISLTSNQTLLFGRVIYIRDLQEELLRELFDDYLQIYKKYRHSYQRKYLYEAIEDNILVYSVFMKDSAFKCEDEFRIAVFEKGSVPLDLCYREKSGAFMPYIEKSIDLKSITSIMVSPTTRTDFVKRSVASMSKHFGVEGLEIKNSSIPLRY